MNLYENNGPVYLPPLSFKQDSYTPSNQNRLYTKYTEYPINSLSKPSQLSKFLIDLGLTGIDGYNVFKNPDKFAHTGITNMLSSITGRPIASMLGFSFGKELVHDKMLGRGTPEMMDVGANSLGMLKYILDNERK